MSSSAWQSCALLSTSASAMRHADQWLIKPSVLLSTSASASSASSATSATVWPRTWQSCALLSASSSARLIGAQRPAGHERQGLERLERRQADENEL